MQLSWNMLLVSCRERETQRKRENKEMWSHLISAGMLQLSEANLSGHNNIPVLCFLQSVCDTIANINIVCLVISLHLFSPFAFLRFLIDAIQTFTHKFSTVDQLHSRTEQPKSNEHTFIF